jgi:outer membrane protein assembly factor BamB
VVGYRGQLASVAAESGQVLWSRDVRSYEGLSVDLQNVYVSGADSDLSAMLRQTGSDLWKHEQLMLRDISGPTAYRNSVVVGDFEGYVHFFDTATGELQARVRAGSDRVTSPPVVVSETIYVQTDGGDLAAFRQLAK